jgi:hypothetical protein
MARPGRRSVPDNLDPLVDTLSNVVGILVIVVVLTQIQLGDALHRVAELDFLRTRENRAREARPEESRALDLRREALMRRTDVGVEESIALAKQTLEALAAQPSKIAAKNANDLDRLTRKVAEAKSELEAAQRVRDRRAQRAEELRVVPKRLVARLPDPQIVTGRESWILVRYGRVYLVDRQKLFDEGSRAIKKILADAQNGMVRRDEWEAVARYLRKQDVGLGDFRWQLKIGPQVQVELEWRTKDGGIELEDLESSEAFQTWLASRSPDEDVITFQVWSDSFETYLGAREIVEREGFHAGWRGHEADEDLEIGLRFGPEEPDVAPVQVD